jgi:hypothetical protein
MSKVNYQLIRDKPKIEKFLSLIQLDLKNFKHTRIDKYSSQFYYELGNETGITFKVYNPSNYAINQMKNEKE